MDRGVVEIQVPYIKYKYESNTLKVNEILESLNCDLSNILYDTPVRLSYSELYNFVDDLCVVAHDDDVRQTQHSLIEHYIYTRILELDMLNDVDFLVCLRDLWSSFKAKVSLIRNIYLPIEVSTMKKHHRKYVINQMAHESFSHTLLQDKRIKCKVIYMFDMFDQYRNITHKRNEMREVEDDELSHRKIDIVLLKNLVSMFTTLDLYDDYFEVTYLTYAECYYRQARVSMIELTIFEYFCALKARRSQEQELVATCLEARTWKKMHTVMQRIFIEEVFSTLVEKVSAENVFAGEIQDIALICKQMSYVPKAKDEICAIFSKYMLQKGRSITCDKVEANIIPQLLAFKDRVDLIVFKACGNAYAWIDAVRMAFKRFINCRKNKPAQLLAKFIDSKMRDKLQPEDLFDKTIVMFRYLQPKDIFEAYYKRYLAKRLLLGKSSSQDAEKAMIGKLKYECGDGFTAKLEGMYRDVDLSEGLIQAFKQRAQRSCDTIDFTAQVLTCSFWPTFSKFKVTLPESMQRYHNLYQEFYMSKYSGRSLEWPGSLDTCLLKARFAQGGGKELQVSLFQAIILLLFNNSTRVGYTSMKELLHLEEIELKRTLGSFLGTRINLLKKIVRKDNAQALSTIVTAELAESLDDGDEFEVNDKFEHKLFRIKMNQLQYKDSEEEQKITEDGVLHDRNLHIDAAVVRLMKQHQTLAHNELVTKLYGVLKFPINHNDIKKRIEVLIERDFLARNPIDSSGYIYVA